MERAPQEYDFGGYRALFEAVKRVGLRVQAVMSFHACGGNVGDSTQVPLPQWVLQVGDTPHPNGRRFWGRGSGSGVQVGDD